ncbi:hypothetical protein JCM5350_006684 [Sporobolomyces pararoseus]
MTRLPTSSTIPIASLLSSPPSPLSFIYSSHSRWPYPPNSTSSFPIPTISVLDSSFNPPHAAHKALAETAAVESSSKSSEPPPAPAAQLLTFTISNADKQLDKKDLYTRLEMIRAMAIDMNRQSQNVVEDKGGERGQVWNNVAVAVLDAATFVKKAEILTQEIPKLLQGEGEGDVIKPNLVFPVGWDTLIRIFATRYYPPPGPGLSSSMETLFSKNQSRLVCARRGGTTAQQHRDQDEEREFLSRPEVYEWVEMGKLKIVDLGTDNEKVKGISSTEIRNAVKEDDWDKVEEMVPFPSVIEVIQKERLYRE